MISGHYQGFFELNQILFLFIGYLVGSIPTGYLAVRLRSGSDIRTEGSGKTGGFNTYTVTRSRMVAIGVGLFDAFKGFAIAWTAWQMYPDDPTVQAASIVGALLGHNYPVWLRFKGGRGLATVAGALFALGQFLLVFWCVAWFVVYRWKKDILLGNVSATAVSLVAVWAVPHQVLSWFMIRDVDPVTYATFTSVILVLLLIGHQDGIRELLSSRTVKGDNNA